MTVLLPRSVASRLGPKAEFRRPLTRAGDFAADQTTSATGGSQRESSASVREA